MASVYPTYREKLSYISDSWLVFDTLICPHGRPDDAWLGVTERFSERICLGSDVFGRFATLAKTMARYTPFLEALSDRARRDLTLDTARRLYDKPALEPL